MIVIKDKTTNRDIKILQKHGSVNDHMTYNLITKEISINMSRQSHNDALRFLDECIETIKNLEAEYG